MSPEESQPLTWGRRPSPQAMASVRRTAAAVADRPVLLAEAFYTHLFALAPGVRDMFPTDMTAQNERLCAALLASIRALVGSDQDTAAMEVTLARLGTLHARHHGVKPEHYPYVGQALIRAVRDLTGDRSVGLSSAWAWVFEWMSAHMLRPTD